MGPYKFSKRPNRRRLGRIAAAEVKNAPSPTDVWLLRGAHLSQLLLLALGIFGYFYTVRPAFQNQLLQEQTARLELEKSSIQKQLEVLVQKRRSVQLESDRSAALLAYERDKNRDIEAQAVKARTNAAEAMAQAQAARKLQETIEDELLASRAQLDHLNWQSILTSMSYHLSQETSKTLPQIDTFEFIADYFNEVRIQWKSPRSELLTALLNTEVASRELKIPRYYFRKIEEEIWASKELDCSLPDFHSLKEGYFRTLDSASAEAQKKVDQLGLTLAADSRLHQLTPTLLQERFRVLEHLKVEIAATHKLEISQNINLRRASCTAKSWQEIGRLRKKRGLPQL